MMYRIRHEEAADKRPVHIGTMKPAIVILKRMSEFPKDRDAFILKRDWVESAKLRL